MPVGAITVVWALRKPWLVPSCRARSHAALGVRDQLRIGTGGVVERHRVGAQELVAEILAMRGAAMVADDAQHRLGVLAVARERPELGRHLGGGGVGHAGHDGREGAAQGAAGGRVVGQAHGHEEAADIGVAEPERAVIVGEPRDLLRRELRHQHRDFEDQRPQADEVLVAVDVEDARSCGRRRRGGWRRRDCRPCRPRTCIRSTDWTSGSDRRPGRCATRSWWC